MSPDAAQNAFLFSACMELSATFARTCLGGGLAALMAWAVCRGKWGQRLGARVRFALWWLVCLKFMTGVFCAGFAPAPLQIAAPLLPAPLVAQSAVDATKAAVRPLLHRARPSEAVLTPRPFSFPSAWTTPAQAAQKTATFTAVSNNDAGAFAGDGEADAAAPTSANAPAPRRDADENAPLLAALPCRGAILLVLVYFCGLLMAASRTLRAARKVRVLVQNAREVGDPVTRDAAEQTAQAVFARAGKTPRLCESARAASPFVFGMVRPVLVLPCGFAQTVTPTQLRLALAHEMAHLRRGDLWTGLLPQITQLILWFFPPALLACRECLEAGEEACDACALAACPQSERSDLGHLLLGLSQTKPLLAPALGMAAAPGFARLKRRLHALQPTAPLGGWGKVGTLLLAAVFGASVLPWRISAAEANAEETKAAPTASAAAEQGVQVPRYEIVDLGVPGETYSDACAISDTGVVVGTTSAAQTSGRGVAFAYNAQTGRREEVGAAPYRRSVAVGISSGGTIAGTAYNRRTRPQAFVWKNQSAEAMPSAAKSAQSRTFLWPLPPFRYSQASGINDGNQVVGTVHGLPREGVLPARAFLYRDNTIRDLGTLGGPYSHASAISPSGLVVGKADVARKNRRELFQTHAFVVQTGPNGATEPLHDLGTLPGGKNSRAWGVNAQNEVVGFSEGADNTQHAFLYAAPDAPLRDLGTLPGKSSSVAYAINDRGLIVGTANGGGGAASSAKQENTEGAASAAAVLWVRGSGGITSDAVTPVDLNAQIPQNSGWVLQTARGINRQGWIVGQGMVHGKQRAFLLKPISPPRQ